LQGPKLPLCSNFKSTSPRQHEQKSHTPVSSRTFFFPPLLLAKERRKKFMDH
jgi:hypothetical protein